VDVMGLLAEPGDVFILCTDGLANMLEDQEILDIVRARSLEEVPATLVALANERGGDDNITVVAVRTELAEGSGARSTRVVRSP